MANFVPPFISPDVMARELRRRAEQERLDAEHGAGSETAADAMRAWEAANPEPESTLSQVADHIDHIRAVAGIDHVGIGGDLDGVTSTPVGLEDVSKYPELTAELLRREYSDEDVLKILGGNVLRVMRQTERVSLRLREQRGRRRRSSRSWTGSFRRGLTRIPVSSTGQALTFPHRGGRDS